MDSRPSCNCRHLLLRPSQHVFHNLQLHASNHMLFQRRSDYSRITDITDIESLNGFAEQRSEGALQSCTMCLAILKPSSVALGRARSPMFRSVKRWRRPISPLRGHTTHKNATSGSGEVLYSAIIGIDWTRVLMLGAAIATLVQSLPPYLSTDLMVNPAVLLHFPHCYCPSDNV